MMISREAADIDIDGTKQEGGRQGGNTAAASSSASSWSRLKDPRIVRVSKAFGGKDRHSKVCTVRGLRDRRVRLSVPTAIQLYDLQDRLGLNQPSKVVDWLLNAAKHEIDELPPLQMPPNSSSSGNFIHPHNFQPLMLASNNSQLLQATTTTTTTAATTTRGGLVMKIGNTSSSSSINWDDGDAILRTKAKEEESAAARESNVDEEEAEEEAEEEEEEEEEGGGGGGEEADNNNNKRQSHFEGININNHGAYINVSPSSNFFSSRHSSTPPPAGGLDLLSNSSAQQPYSSLIRWDPSTLSLAQSQPHQSDDFHNNFNVVSLASGPHPHPHPPHHHQVLVYQPAAAGGIAAAHSSYFPSHITNATEYAPKQINFQMLMSSTNPPNNNSLSNSLTPANEGRPFHFTTNFLPTQKDCGK